MWPAPLGLGGGALLDGPPLRNGVGWAQSKSWSSKEATDTGLWPDSRSANRLETEVDGQEWTTPHSFGWPSFVFVNQSLNPDLKQSQPFPKRSAQLHTSEEVYECPGRWTEGPGHPRALRAGLSELNSAGAEWGLCTFSGGLCPFTGGCFPEGPGPGWSLPNAPLSPKVHPW